MDLRAEIDELTDLLIKYQKSYYVDGVSLVSDTEYDGLFDRLSKLERDYPHYARPDSPTVRVGSDLTSDFPEVEHTIPVLSLDKAYSDSAVLDFMRKCQERMGEELSFVEEEKIDGISMVLYYEDGVLRRAVTRGNGHVGNDVTANVKTIKSVPLKLPERVDIAVRGEVYLPIKEFQRLKEKDDSFQNPRNLAAGAVRRQKSSETAEIPLDIFVYEGFWQNKVETPKDHVGILSELKRLGFRINPHIALFSKSQEKSERMLKDASLEGEAHSFDALGDYINKVTGLRKSLPYEIDGMVTKINELDIREELGYTEHHPRWAIAYKFESPQASTKLIGITIQVGRTGRITPVAELEPVRLGGSTVRRATLHNQEYIDELEIAIGDTVSVVKRGDVIPAVEEVLEKNPEGHTTFSIPHECPACGSRLEERGAHLFCPNSLCSEQIVGRITFFTSRDQMDMETFGPETVKVLVDEDLVKEIPDLYTADYTKLLDSPQEKRRRGFGSQSVKLLFQAVEESRKRPFATVLSSLGLPEIGKKGAEMLIKGGFKNIDMLLDAATREDREAFLKIPQIGIQTSESLIKALNDTEMRSMIEKLRNAGLQFEAVEEENNLEQTFSGQVWCVTGSFENFNPRSLAMKEVERRGGRTVSSVTGATTHLLVGKGGGSKAEKAKGLGVKLVSEEEFLSMLHKEEEKKEERAEAQLSLF